MDTGRRQEAPGLEKKDFIIHSTTNNMKLFYVGFYYPKVPQRGHREPRWMLGHDSDLQNLLF